MKVLEGKSVADNIKLNFKERIDNLSKLGKNPHIAVLGIVGDQASEMYIKRIENNCLSYGIKFTLKLAADNEEFIRNFQEVKNDKSITGIMFQQPLDKELVELINEIDPKRDVEGIGINNIGKLMLGKEDALITCTSKAVLKTLEFYNIDLQGKKVVLVGRSNIVGKPLIPQLLAKNATLTICHSKTEKLSEEIKQADIVIMAIGRAKFLKADSIKENAIVIDIGINFDDGKLVGDVDYQDIENKASACTPVPGGIGTVTNAILIDNIIKSCEIS